MTIRILVGDCRDTLASLPDRSVQTCVTSPPYFGLRDYGHSGQIGLEPTPDEYVAQMVAVFREVRRVLRDDGTLWLNLGDSYAGSMKGANGDGTWQDRTGTKQGTNKGALNIPPMRAGAIGLKNKDLIGIPWRVAFALQDDGWYLRSDIIWHKPNPMPESVTDRPTKSHEYLFLLSKNERYFYDAAAIAEESNTEWNAATSWKSRQDLSAPELAKGADLEKMRTRGFGSAHNDVDRNTRNKRTVWTVPTSPFKGAHFATFPPALIEPCIKAGSAKGDTVLDPFGGAGTTGLVADRLGRDAILCELNAEYANIARKRISDDNPLFSEVA